MKFNTKTRYGLRTMLELALHADNEDGVFQKDIAIAQKVSVKYLDQIIASLKKAELVKNVGGKKSGYKLGRPANKITVYDIYIAFDKELAIIDCLVPGKSCPTRKHCVMRDYWSELNETIRSSMGSKDLAELARQHLDTKEN